MKNPTIQPIADFVLLKREPRERMTPAGIILSTDEVATGGARGLRRGEVLAVGPGRWSKDGTVRVPMSVKPGERVLFSPTFSGMESKKTAGSALQAEQVLLRDSDVCAVEEG